MNIKEEERRARLLKMREERLPDIKKQFEEAQKRNFNSNFAPGGKDANLVAKPKKATKKAAKKAEKAPKPKTEAEQRKVNLSVTTKKGEMVHHQRMLSQDVNAQ
ncbi:MAG: hypothetical protein Q4A33_02685, partial [Candidatus Saccharibacteria bacterium]|nr:hypothetical protein [Candidatus Saccharibacteria bacterium]